MDVGLHHRDVVLDDVGQYLRLDVLGVGKVNGATAMMEVRLVGGFQLGVVNGATVEDAEALCHPRMVSEVGKFEGFLQQPLEVELEQA